jgi:hypothetical protein
VIAFWNNVAIVDTCGALEVPHMKAIGLEYLELLSQHKSGIVVFCMMQPDVPIASSEVRNECMRYLKQLDGGLLHLCLVVESQGVLGMMLHAVVRGMNVLLPNSRMTLHDTLPDATAKIAPLVRPSAPRDTITRDISGIIDGMRKPLVPWQPH